MARARGRTGCSRSSGGAGRRCGAQGSAHRASSLLRHSSSPNPSSPPPDSQGCLAHTHALHWRISRQSRLPPGVLGDALHQGLPLRSHRETKGQSDRCSPAEISTSPHLCREKKKKKKSRKPSLVGERELLGRLSGNWLEQDSSTGKPGEAKQRLGVRAPSSASMPWWVY